MPVLVRWRVVGYDWARAAVRDFPKDINPRGSSIARLTWRYGQAAAQPRNGLHPFIASGSASHCGRPPAQSHGLQDLVNAPQGQ